MVRSTPPNFGQVQYQHFILHEYVEYFYRVLSLKKWKGFLGGIVLLLAVFLIMQNIAILLKKRFERLKKFSLKSAIPAIVSCSFEEFEEHWIILGVLEVLFSY